MKKSPFRKLKENGKDWRTLDKKNERQRNQDLSYEGKDQVYLDIDRIINEGLSGGSIHRRNDTTNIEEARELTVEEPPNSVE